MPRNKKTISEKENSVFATRLRALLGRKTQAEFADAIGKSHQLVSQYIHGQSEPTFDALGRIANYFHVSTDYLLGLSESRSLDISKRAACEYTGLSDGAVYVLHDNVGCETSVVLDKLLKNKVFIESIVKIAWALSAAAKCSAKANIDAEYLSGDWLQMKIVEDYPEYEGQISVYVGKPFVYKLLDDAVSDYRDAARAIVKSRMGD